MPFPPISSFDGRTKIQRMIDALRTKIRETQPSRADPICYALYLAQPDEGYIVSALEDGLKIIHPHTVDIDQLRHASHPGVARCAQESIDYLIASEHVIEAMIAYKKGDHRAEEIHASMAWEKMGMKDEV